ncbi:hypothetical protein [Burkholderia anthina]|uniref:hypothetical protein n=1 Tax=Burkholderia anthina TaxID=179879 RepID=UPI001ABA8EE0|nr:hypothetical protein [Burkholderia anthina]
MTDTTTSNNPGAMPAPINVLREMDRFEATMRRAFDYTPDRNPSGEVVPHAEEAYRHGRDNDRFMGFCMAVAAGSGGRTIPAGTLLDIARETGLRSFLPVADAAIAQDILARYQLAVDRHRESLPANPERQVSGWVYDATRKALDAVHAVCLEFGCPRGETVADWLRARLAAPAIVQPAVAPINDREPSAVADLPHFPTMLRKMWSGGEVQRWIDDNIKPLVQERHFDFHCGSSAPSPADERAAFDVALDALWRHQQNWDTGLPAEHAQGERIAMECACEAVREALEEARAASTTETGAEAVAIPAGYALVPIERSYDMRAKALIAFNTTEQGGKDRDDALDAAYRAELAAAPLSAQANTREGLTDDQRHTVECADAWLTDKGLPTYTVLRALLAAHPGQPEPCTEAADTQRERVCQAIAEALGDAYDCVRCWSAWGVGTMGPDDFRQVADDPERVAEIAEAALRAMTIACPVQSEAGDLSLHELDAWRAVVRERRRQIAEEGYTLEHDDSHVNAEIAALAAVYAMPPGAREWPATETGYGDTFEQALLPDGWRANTGDRSRELEKAGALIVAELGRYYRAARAGGAV